MVAHPPRGWLNLEREGGSTNCGMPDQSERNIQAMVGLERFLPLLEYLEAHKGHLEHLLQTTDSKQIPHYNFHGGNTITKSVSMSSNLDQLIRDFAKEMGVSQRVIFETALIQFMERYGYTSQVSILLQ